MFRNWANTLPPTVELCPIQLPGRENRLREPPFSRISPLVEALAQALEHSLNLPFAVFGHSMGALIGFELARELRRRSLPTPALLFVSGRRAPHQLDADLPIHERSRDEFIREVQLRYNSIPEAVRQDSELMELLLPSLRADFALTESYVYYAEAPLDCPIFAFGGVEDPKVSHNDLALWSRQTCRSFSLRMLPGEHFFLQSAQSVLLQAISQELDGAVQNPEGGSPTEVAAKITAGARDGKTRY